jgi:hypothetical protein
MTLNQDGNVIGRVGALAVVVLTLWGVQRINAGKFTMCPIDREKAGTSCCMTEGKTEAPAEAPAEAAATPAPDATPAKH